MARFAGSQLVGTFAEPSPRNRRKIGKGLEWNWVGIGMELDLESEWGWDGVWLELEWQRNGIATGRNWKGSEI